jgi:hypothetical protein
MIGTVASISRPDLFAKVIMISASPRYIVKLKLVFDFYFLTKFDNLKVELNHCVIMVCLTFVILCFLF